MSKQRANEHCHHIHKLIFIAIIAIKSKWSWSCRFCKL